MECLILYVLGQTFTHHSFKSFKSSQLLSPDFVHFFSCPELNHESSNIAQVGHCRAHSDPFIGPQSCQVSTRSSLLEYLKVSAVERTLDILPGIKVIGNESTNLCPEILYRSYWQPFLYKNCLDFGCKVKWII